MVGVSPIVGAVRVLVLQRSKILFLCQCGLINMRTVSFEAVTVRHLSPSSTLTSVIVF